MTACQPLCWKPLLVMLVTACSTLVRAGEIQIETVSAGALENEEQVAFLKAHNAARKAVGIGPLAWSRELSEHAREWVAENSPVYQTDAVAGRLPTIAHRPPEGKFARKHGENIAAWGGTGEVSTDAAHAVRMWLEEKTAFDALNKDHAYKVGDANGKRDAAGNPVIVGHYTQIVWKHTTKCGAAKWLIKFKDNAGVGRTAVVIVCNYDPPGNYVGEKPY